MPFAGWRASIATAIVPAMSNPSNRRNLLGIACLCLGVAIFSTQDAIIKGISGNYAVTQAMVTRSLVALPILAVFVQWEGGLRQLRSPRFWMLDDARLHPVPRLYDLLHRLPGLAACRCDRAVLHGTLDDHLPRRAHPQRARGTQGMDRGRRRICWRAGHAAARKRPVRACGSC